MAHYTFVIRRAVAVGVVLVVLVIAASLARAVIAAVIPQAPSIQPTVVESAGATADAASFGSAIVVVGAGDTLWSIARSIQPEGDVRPLVQRLSELNGGAALQVGQALRLP